MIPITCSCGKSITVGDQLAGKKIRCLNCKAVLEVPLNLELIEPGSASNEPTAEVFEATLADVTAPPKPVPKAPKPAAPKPPEPEKKGSSLLYVLLGGGALAAVACCVLGGVGTVAVFFIPSLNPFGGPANVGAGGGQLASKPAHEKPVKALAFSADGKLLATCGGSEIKVWSVATGDPVATLTGHAGEVTALAFPPQGEELVSAATDQTIKLWDLKTKKYRLNVNRKGDAVKSLAFSGDQEGVDTGTFLAAGATDALVVDTGEKKIIGYASGYNNGSRPLLWGRTDVTMAWGTAVKTVNVTERDAKGQVFPPDGVGSDITQIARPPGRTLIACLTKASVKLIDSNRPNDVGELIGHKDPPKAAVFSPDGALLATGDDGTILLWNMANRNKVADLRGGLRFEFTRDGHTLVFFDRQEKLQLWTAPAGPAGPGPDVPGLNAGGAVSVLALSPTERKAAVAFDNVVRIVSLP